MHAKIHLLLQFGCSIWKRRGSSDAGTSLRLCNTYIPSMHPCIIDTQNVVPFDAQCSFPFAAAHNKRGIDLGQCGRWIAPLSAIRLVFRRPRLWVGRLKNSVSDGSPISLSFLFCPVIFISLQFSTKSQSSSIAQCFKRRLESVFDLCTSA